MPGARASGIFVAARIAGFAAPEETAGRLSASHGSIALAKPPAPHPPRDAPMHRILPPLTAVLLLVTALANGQQPQQDKKDPQDKGKNTNLGKDKDGNPLRLATKTGHVSNYDEAKVKPYTLPDPLTLANGKPVKDAETWFKQRRPEILKLFQTEIFGRIPDNAPKVKWEVAATEEGAMNGTATLKKLVGKVGDRADGPRINVSLYLPA